MNLDLTAWAERFVATSSVSHEGNKAISACAAELLQSAGMEARLATVSIAGVSHRAVISDLGPASDPSDGLLMITHLDTVPAGNPAAWTRTGGDPLRPTRDGDHLYGLGSADAKVDFVCKVAGLSGIDRKALRRRIRVVGTFGEEIGLLGTRWLVDSGHTRGFRYALVGEPSELVAIHAHKGYAVFNAQIPLRALPPSTGGVVENHDFEGQSAHSSTPHLGRNAIEEALEQLIAAGTRGFREFSGGSAVNQVPERASVVTLRESNSAAVKPRESTFYDVEPLRRFLGAWRELMNDLHEPSDGRFDPSHTVGNLGRVTQNENELVVTFDLRPVPGIDAERAVKPLNDAAQVRCVRQNPALATDTESPLLKAVTASQEAIGLGSRIGTKATCTEAGILSQAGMDAIILGAGPSVGNVHRPNEFTRISELHQARELYRETVERLCVDAAEDQCSS